LREALPDSCSCRSKCDPWRAFGRIKAFAPDAIHVATEGPLGFSTIAWLRLKKLRFTTSFAEALERIHDTVGCEDVVVKPELLYKLSTAKANTLGISLSSQTDWEGCLEQVTDIEATNKKATVTIVVPEQVRNHLLRMS